MLLYSDTLGALEAFAFPLESLRTWGKRLDLDLVIVAHFKLLASTVLFIRPLSRWQLCVVLEAQKGRGVVAFTLHSLEFLNLAAGGNPAQKRHFLVNSNHVYCLVRAAVIDALKSGVVHASKLHGLDHGAFRVIVRRCLVLSEALRQLGDGVAHVMLGLVQRWQHGAALDLLDRQIAGMPVELGNPLCHYYKFCYPKINKL